MKNVYLLPTNPNDETKKGIWIKETRDWSNIYITSSDEQIRGDWVLYTNPNSNRTFIVKCTDVTSTYFDYERLTLDIRQVPIEWAKKIILTTDPQLIADGVQAIDDEFLEWFVKNPSCEEVEIGVRYEDEWIDNEDGGEIFQHQYCCYKIIIPNLEIWKDIPEFEDKETILEAAERIFNIPEEKNGDVYFGSKIAHLRKGFKFGAKWMQDRMQDRMYSEEEVRELLLTQRGNSYVAILTKTKDSELASLAMSAPEPSGKNGWVKLLKKK